MLLHFLRWVKANTIFDFDVLLIKDGTLKDQFIETGHVFLWGKSFQENLWDKLVRRLFGYSKRTAYENKLLETLKKNNYSLIYANSVASSSLLNQIQPIGQMKVILHVHELETVIQNYLKGFNEVKGKVNKFIAASNLVKQNLFDKHALAPERTSTIYEFLPAVKKETLQRKEELKTKLGIPEDAFIVGGSGTIQPRKGTDFFIQTAREVLSTHQGSKPIYFVWLGRVLDHNFYRSILYDIEKYGISSKIIFLDEQLNPLDYLNTFDILAMTSREDPFPLVCIECGQLGIPIICFNKGVGSVEFLDDTTGKIVPYGDAKAISESIIYYYNSPDALIRAGEEVKQKASSFTVDKIAPKLLATIKDVLDSSH